MRSARRGRADDEQPGHALVVSGWFNGWGVGSEQCENLLELSRKINETGGILSFAA